MHLSAAFFLLGLANAEVVTVDDPFAQLARVAPVVAPAKRSFFNILENDNAELSDVEILKNKHSVRLQPRSDDAPCDFYPEIVLVQDVTQSFDDDMVNLKRLMPQLFEMFQRRFEGKVRFGITTFVDKYHPDTNWAHEDDYCVQLNMPLTDVSDPQAMNKAMNTFANLQIYGGNDYHDGANEGLLRAALSDAVGWRNITHDPVTGRPILRLLVLATDAALHEAGYSQDLYELEPRLPANSLVSHPEIVAEDINAQCGNMDFPTGDDIAKALDAKNIIPIIFSGNPKQTGYERIWAQYKKEWVKRFDQYGWWDDLEFGLARYYADYFANVVKRDAVVQLIDETSSNFVEVFEEAMAQVTNLTCLPPAISSTEEPTTEESTTEKRSTTVATEKETTALPSSESTIASVPSLVDTTQEQIVASTEDDVVSTSEAAVKTTEIPSSSSDDGDEPLLPFTPESPSEPAVTQPSAPVTAEAPETETTTGQHDSTTTEEEAGGSNAAVIGSAAGGGGVVAVAAALAAAKKMGFLFNGSSAPDVNITTDVETPEVTADREQFEAVTGDLFA